MKLFKVVFVCDIRAGASGTTIPTTGRNSDYPLMILAESFGDAEAEAMRWATDNNTNAITYSNVLSIVYVNNTTVLVAKGK